MLRYFALATLIVLGAIAVLLALPRPPARDAASRFSSGRGRDGPGEAVSPRATAEPLTGDAPWALSAVPNCFRQRASFSGTAAFARAHIPADAAPVRAGTRITIEGSGTRCVLTIGADRAELLRGSDRLTIPAPARFFVAKAGLVLDERSGAREEVRIYAYASPAAMAAWAAK